MNTSVVKVRATYGDSNGRHGGKRKNRVPKSQIGPKLQREKYTRRLLQVHWERRTVEGSENILGGARCKATAVTDGPL